LFEVAVASASPAKHIDLLPQDQVFRFSVALALKRRARITENQLEQIGHQDCELTPSACCVYAESNFRYTQESRAFWKDLCCSVADGRWRATPAPSAQGERAITGASGYSVSNKAGVRQQRQEFDRPTFRPEMPFSDERRVSLLKHK